MIFTACFSSHLKFCGNFPWGARNWLSRIVIISLLHQLLKSLVCKSWLLSKLKLTQKSDHKWCISWNSRASLWRRCWWSHDKQKWYVGTLKNSRYAAKSLLKLSINVRTFSSFLSFPQKVRFTFLNYFLLLEFSWNVFLILLFFIGFVALPF